MAGTGTAHLRAPEDTMLRVEDQPGHAFRCWYPLRPGEVGTTPIGVN